MEKEGNDVGRGLHVEREVRERSRESIFGSIR